MRFALFKLLCIEILYFVPSKSIYMYIFLLETNSLINPINLYTKLVVFCLLKCSINYISIFYFSFETFQN